MFPDYKDEIDAITNGVHWRWVSEPIRELFDRQWKSWRTNYKLLQNAIELDDLSLFDAHIENKLTEFLGRVYI